MDKHTLNAFAKMQRLEHRIRVLQDLRGLKRITYAECAEQIKEAKTRYALTEEEQNAYEMADKYQRKTK